MDEYQLKKEIEMQRGQSPYSYWTVGVTDDPVKKKCEYEVKNLNTKYWCAWQGDSAIIVRKVEEWFIIKGMKRGVGKVIQPSFIYVF